MHPIVVILHPFLTVSAYVFFFVVLHLLILCVVILHPFVRFASPVVVLHPFVLLLYPLVVFHFFVVVC